MFPWSLIRASAVGLAVALSTGCGHPRLWQFSHFQPKQSDLVGTYRVARFDGNVDRIEGFSSKDPIEIALHPDHSATVSDLPEFDGFGDAVICKLSGSAKWELRSAPFSWDIVLRFDSLPRSSGTHPLVRQCYPEFHLHIVGHAAPYGLYDDIGDPDDDTGIQYRRGSR